MPLTDAEIRVLKPGDRPRKISDSGGLFILVPTSGSKLWRFAYRFQGRQKVLALGAYPAVSLSAARRARDAAREQLAAGEDPCAAKQVVRLEQKLANRGRTFRDVANEWFDNNRDRWVESYSSRLRSRLDADLIRKLGDRPIEEIKPVEVLEAIRAIERRDAVEMGRRVLQMASAIFCYAVATSRCERDPTTGLHKALRARKAVKHRSALRAAELPDFARQLRAYSGDPQTRLALELVLLTFVRTSELRFVQWREFEDLDGAAPLWRIPAERMKMRRPHLVPLAPQVIPILRDLQRFSGRSEFVLPARTRSGVISENTLIYALYRMGYHGRATVHGFRATASTILNEQQFNRDWIEMQLAHSDGGVRSIYNGAEWLPGRREMMVWWANYLDGVGLSQAPLFDAPSAPSPQVRRKPTATDQRIPRRKESGKDALAGSGSVRARGGRRT